MGGMLNYNPGQQFVVRVEPIGAGTADVTVVVTRNDIDTIGGAKLAVTTATSTTSIKCATVITNSYLGMAIEFTEAVSAASALNVGERRILTTWTLSDGTMSWGKALPQTPQVGDKFKIVSLVPRGCSKVALARIASRIPTSANRVAAGIGFACADGFKWEELLADAGGAVNPAMPIPIEFDLAAHGDLTITIDSTGTWTASTVINLMFVCT